jgi:hypothetical protein
LSPPAGKEKLFLSQARIRLLVTLFALAASGVNAQVLPCPPTNSLYFALPTTAVAQTADVNAVAYMPTSDSWDMVPGGAGVQYVDINDDSNSLVDLLRSASSSGNNHFEYWQCIYINTGHSWVLVTDAAHAATDQELCHMQAKLRIRGVEMPFNGLDVRTFRDSVVAEFGIAAADVTVTNANGAVQGGLVRLSGLVKQGFSVVLYGS